MQKLQSEENPWVDHTPQVALENSRNGNNNTALISLKTSSILKPTILKGRRSSHTRGKRKSMIRAMGQQTTSKIHHRTREIKTFILFLSWICKLVARLNYWDFQGRYEYPETKVFINVQSLFRGEHIVVHFPKFPNFRKVFCYTQTKSSYPHTLTRQNWQLATDNWQPFRPSVHSEPGAMNTTSCPWHWQSHCV